MMWIAAPYPNMQTITVLPNPDLNNNIGIVGNLILKTSMNGTRYTYGQFGTTAIRRLTFSFSKIARGKALELIEFYRSYASSYLLVTDWRNVQFRCLFTENMLQTSMKQLSRLCSVNPSPPPTMRPEQGDWVLSVQGVAL